MSTPQYTRRTRGYTHKRRLGALQAHFNSDVLIQRKTVTQDDFGEEQIVYVADQSLTGLRAYAEPQIAGAGEDREADQTVVINRWLVYLQGYYPSIRVDDRAIIDGVAHNILNVMHDDSDTLTAIATEIINPAGDEAIPN